MWLFKKNTSHGWSVILIKKWKGLIEKCVNIVLFAAVTSYHEITWKLLKSDLNTLQECLEKRKQRLLWHGEWWLVLQCLDSSTSLFFDPPSSSSFLGSRDLCWGMTARQSWSTITDCDWLVKSTDSCSSHLRRLQYFCKGNERIGLLIY